MKSKDKLKNYVLIGSSLLILNGCALIKGAFDAAEFILDKGVSPVIEKTTDPVYNTIEKVPPIKGYMKDYTPPPKIYKSDLERLIEEGEECISEKWELFHLNPPLPIYGTYLACAIDDREHNGEHCYCLDTLIRIRSLKEDKK